MRRSSTDGEREGWIPYDPDAQPRVVESEPARPTGETSFLDPPPTVKRRFRVIYVALALIALAAAAAFATFLVREPGQTAAVGERWSEWVPEGSPFGRAQEIANRVAEGYRLGGKQLVGVLAGPPLITSNQPEGSSQILVSTIAVRPDLPAGGSSTVDDLVFTGVNGQNSIQYVLCGFGTNCSIAVGKPSAERHTLLRREALELALYTFKYLANINSVSVFLPPRPDGAAAPTMIFLERADLAGELARPLEQTLARTTPKIGEIPQLELERVNRLTQKRLFQYDYTQAQDGSVILLLDPVVT